MKRRTLDITFAGGGLLVAALLAVLAFAIGTQYAFARDYVKEQLSSQKIVFATADRLSAEEKSWKPGSSCLVAYAGQTLETGAQAECYANYFIALHMETAATKAGFPGATYATLGGARTELSAQVASAKKAGDTAAAEAAQKKLDAATSLRSTMLTGDTLRGMLMTTYGFGVIGEMAGLASNVMWALAAVMAALSAAGFVHALFTPKDEIVFASAAKRAARAVEA